MSKPPVIPECPQCYGITTHYGDDCWTHTSVSGCSHWFILGKMRFISRPLWNSSDREKCLSCFGPDALRIKGPLATSRPLEAVQLALHRESESDSSLSVSDCSNRASFWKQGRVVFAFFTLPGQNEWKKEQKYLSLNPNTGSSNCIIFGASLFSYS